jgi:prepilin signal peptidase PulO-like enzyme (type II secretory pathway)
MEALTVFMVASAAGFGLIIGSFLNVVVLRHNTGRTVLGRSGCFSCGASLTTRDLVPFFSYLALGGRCRSCGSAVSVQYPLVEFGTALLFALLAGSGLTPVLLAVSFILAASTMVLIAYDFRHTILPDTFLIVFTLAALMFRLVAEPFTWGLLVHIAEGAAITAAPLLFLWTLSRGRWLGLGDVKLAASIGALLGIAGGLTALWFAYVIGAAVALSLIGAARLMRFVRRNMGIARLSNGSLTLTMKSEIAFGPYLLLGCMIVWISALYEIPIQLIALL